MRQLARESVEDEMATPVGRDNQTLSVVAKLHLGPVYLLSSHEALLVLEEIESCKRRFVVIAHVVEEDGLRGWGGNGYDGRGRVVGGEVGRMQIEQADVVGRLQIPQAHCVVPRTAYEVVF